MRYYELEQQEPQCGDIVGIELGDTLIEAVISDVLEDGVVLQLDESAIDLMIKANKQKLSEAPEPAYKWALDKFAKGDFDPALNQILKGKPQPKLDPVDPEPTPTSTPVSSKQDTIAPDTTKKDITSPVFDKNFKTMDECENAIDWGISTLHKLDSMIAYDLMRAGNETVIAYLRIIARRTNAYALHDFDEDDFEYCEDYLSSALEDSTIDQWVDVLKTSTLNEAKYQGREVQLGKRMAGDVKKSKVYVKGPKGNVVKVNFGDPNMRIKKSDPARRKSFRARHNCDNPGPRWKARYWSCRAW
jgi:hypothetical protein